MLHRSKKIGLYSVDNVPLTVLSVINEGVDGAADIAISAAPSSKLVIEGGRSVVNGFDNTIEIAVLREATNLSDLIDYATSPPTDYQSDADAGLKLAILGLGSSVVCNQNFLIEYQDKISNTTFDSFLATFRKTGIGYNAGVREGGLHFGVNLLGLYEVNSGANGTSVYGFSVTDGAASITRTGASIVLAETSTSNTATFGSELIFFPFVGEVLTASFDLAEAGTNNDASIVFYDEDSAFISRTSFVMSGTGRKTFTATIPANTAFIAFEVTIEASETVTFSNPMIATDNQSTFTLK